MTETDPSRSCTLLNMNCGDVTLAWTPEQDDAMQATIQRAMDVGVTFFVVEPQLGGLVAPTRRRLTEASQARLQRALVMSDEDWGRLIGNGVQVVPTEDLPEPKATATETSETGETRAVVPKSRRAKSAKEAAGARTVATPQRKGG